MKVCWDLFTLCARKLCVRSAWTCCLMWGIGKKLSVVTTKVLFHNDCIRLWQITWKHERSRYLIPVSDECVTASTVECSLCFCPPRKSKTHHQRIYVFNFSLSHIYRDLTDTQRQTLFISEAVMNKHPHTFSNYTHTHKPSHPLYQN